MTIRGHHLTAASDTHCTANHEVESDVLRLINATNNYVSLFNSCSPLQVKRWRNRFCRMKSSSRRVSLHKVGYGAPVVALVYYTKLATAK